MAGALDSWIPTRTFPTVDEIDLSSLNRGTFSVPSHGLTLACRFTAGAVKDRLFVKPGGWVDRKRPFEPSFLPWPGGLFNFGHVLCISDPTLLIDDTLESGAFIGEVSRDGVSASLAVVHAVARNLGVSRDRIAFCGMSGGAFGALMMAIRLPRGRAVVVNPPIDIRLFDQNLSNWVIEIFRSSSMQGIIKDHLTRASVLEALRVAIARNELPRLSIFQNITDHYYHNVHYSLLCRALGIPMTGGIDPTGAVETTLFDAKGGHGGMPADEIILAALAETDAVLDRAG